MLQASLVHPIAKLDIKDLLEPSHAPLPSQATQPSGFTRSASVPSARSQNDSLPSPSSASTTSRNSISTVPPNPYTQRQQTHSSQLLTSATPLSNTAQTAFQQSSDHESTACNKRPRSPDEASVRPRAKKSSKWSQAEDAKIIELRGRGMKWDDISEELLGRSPTSCRLHYQNYLEKRSEWDEERKNKLARVYDRLKPEIWTRVANELGVPWRAVEAMHWSLGEQDMARRANVTPFHIDAARGGRLEASTSANGRVAQRDRMLETTRVFEGRDLSTLSSQFYGNGYSQHIPHAVSSYSIPPAAPLHIAPIKREEEPAEGEKCKLEGRDDENGTKVRKRSSDTGTRLPGLAELDGGVYAFAERERNGFIMVDKVDRRRGSDGSSTSGGSRESR